MKIEISGKEINENQPYVIGEIASAHDGRLDLMKELIKAGHEAGVDAVKVQMFDAEELVAPQHPKYRAFQEIELKPNEWKAVFKFANELGVTLIADVFDRKSAELADKLGAAAFKIHSTNLTNPYLLEQIADFGKPILLATGGSELDEIRYTVDLLKKEGNKQIILMHGYQGNPAKLENTNLRRMKTIEKEFNLPVGISDHVDAEDEMAFIVPKAAISLGAIVVEKHYTNDRSLKGRDYYSSLNPDELAELVSEIKSLKEKELEEIVPDEKIRENILGNSEIKLSEEELEYRNIMKKNIVASKDIEKGEKIELDKLAFKRAESGLSPKDAEKIIGKEAKEDIKKNQVLKMEMLK